MSVPKLNYNYFVKYIKRYYSSDFRINLRLKTTIIKTLQTNMKVIFKVWNKEQSHCKNLHSKFLPKAC